MKKNTEKKNLPMLNFWQTSKMLQSKREVVKNLNLQKVQESHNAKMCCKICNVLEAETMKCKDCNVPNQDDEPLMSKDEAWILWNKAIEDANFNK